MDLSRRLLAALAFGAAATTAQAQDSDCFPMCAPELQTPAPALNLCESGAVREAVRIEQRLRPVKRLYGIATNPTGYALEQVSEKIVPIPRWVGYAIDPKGAVRAKVMDRVRKEVRKASGLQNECAAEIAAESAAAEPSEDFYFMPLPEDEERTAV